MGRHYTFPRSSDGRKGRHYGTDGHPGRDRSLDIVWKVEFTVLIGNTFSIHSLYFDDLTLRELYEDGFCGPVDLMDADGRIHRCELTAGNPVDMDGDLVRNIAFRIDVPAGTGLAPHVTRFSYKTRPSARMA